MNRNIQIAAAGAAILGTGTAMAAPPTLAQAAATASTASCVFLCSNHPA